MREMRGDRFQGAGGSEQSSWRPCCSSWTFGFTISNSVMFFEKANNYYLRARKLAAFLSPKGKINGLRYRHARRGPEDREYVETR